jgi:hypothetical protein
MCAATIVLPHLSKTSPRLHGLEPSVGNLASFLAYFLGMSTESQKTIESRLWAPTKPVAHAAAAWGLLLINVLKDKLTSDHENQLGHRDLVLSAFFYPEIVTRLVEKAEKIRLRLPAIKYFHIQESDTIQFALD